MNEKPIVILDDSEDFILEEIEEMIEGWKTI